MLKDLPDELWERVISFLPDLLDVHVVCTILPSLWSLVLHDPCRRLPALVVPDVEREEGDFPRCRLLPTKENESTRTEGFVTMWDRLPSEKVRASWTSLLIQGQTNAIFPSPFFHVHDRIKSLVLSCITTFDAQWTERLAYHYPRLERLEVIDVWPSTQFNNSPTDSLALCQGLRELSFHGSFLSACTLQPLLTGLSGLTSLDLSYNPWSLQEVIDTLSDSTAHTMAHLGLSGIGTEGVTAETLQRLLDRCPKLDSMFLDYAHFHGLAWDLIPRRTWRALSLRGATWDVYPTPAALRVRSLRAAYVRGDILATFLPTPDWRHVELDYCSNLPLQWLQMAAPLVPHLHSLSMIGCFGLTSEPLSHILQHLPELRTLRLDHTMVDRVPFHGGIETLGTNGSFLTDACLEQLPALRRLVVGVPSSRWNTARMTAWIEANPWFHHVWVRTQFQYDQWLAQYPQCSGSVHLGTLLTQHT